jgi:hypothetical protein
MPNDCRWDEVHTNYPSDLSKCSKLYKACIEVFDQCEKDLKKGKHCDFTGILDTFYGCMKKKGHFLNVLLQEDLFWRAKSLIKLIESSDMR